MLTGDDLSVQLFIFGGGISFAALAVSQAGWTHRVLVICLFVLAAACIAAGLFYSDLKDYSPTLSSDLLYIANSKVSWLVMFSFVITFLILTNRFRLRVRTDIRVFEELTSLSLIIVPGHDPKKFQRKMYIDGSFMK